MTVHLSTLSLAGDKGTPTGDGARYTSMVAWHLAQVALNPNLSGQGDQVILEVYNDFGGDLVDSDSVSITGYTTDENNNVTVRPAAGQWHDGTWGSGFSIRSSANFSNTISVISSYTVIQGIQAEATGNGSQGINIAAAALGCVVEDCLVSGGAGGTNDSGMGARIQTNAAPASTVRNCISVGGRSGFGSTQGGPRLNFHNNFAISPGDAGFRTVGTTTAFLELINNSVMDAGLEDYKLGSNSQETINNNASEDGTAPGVDPIINIGVADFVNYQPDGSGDYTPAASGALDGTAEDLSTLFTTDMLQYVRTSLDWDVGPLAIQSAGIPITFDGGNPIGDISVATGASVNIDLTDGGARWQGTLTPFTYAEVSANLTGSGLSISPAGLLTGNAVTGVYSGVVVRGEDTGATTAESNAFTVTVAVGSTVTIVEATPDDNFVYPRKSDGTGSIARTVNYTGSPTSLEYRVVKGDDPSTVVTAWTVFDAAPAGGVSALDVDVPSQPYAMRLEVRQGDDVGVSDTEDGTWRIGVRVLVIGGTNASNFSYDDPVSGAVSHVQYRPSWESAPGFAYPSSEGAGEKATADLFTAMFGCSVITTSVGVVGSSLLSEGPSGVDAWENFDGDLYTDLVTTVGAMTAGDNILNLIIYMSAEGDYGLSGTDYTGMNIDRGLNALLTNLNGGFLSVSGGRVPVVLDTVPPGNTGTSSQVQGVRDATIRMANADPVVTLVDTTTLAVTGTSTLTTTSQATFGNRAATAIELSGGPNLIGIESSDDNDVLILHFDHNLDTDITSYDTDYIRVESGEAEQPVLTWSRTGTRQVSVVLEGPLSDPTDVVIYLGYGIADGAGADAPLSTAISFSGGSIKLPCKVFSGNLYGII